MKTLSDKAMKDFSNNPIPNYYWEKDVKEFIKKLKEKVSIIISLIDYNLDKNALEENKAKRTIIYKGTKFIDELAGEKLI